ncbi:MAG TPA: xanthine dehydrogenase family protein subunit M [Acidimicrobiia bacterium]|nr:xanthine dehydrogenase family protein subunit M [Acidimicrobiia bacterium]
MYPRAFDYVAASSIEEALRELGNADFAKVMSGGMSLIPMMKLRLLSPDVVVDIGRGPGLGDIDDDGESITIGALVTHEKTAVADVPAALRTAAAWTGDRQVRARGTTCGAVAHADIAADQPSAVLALGGTMVAQGPNGTREIVSDDFFVDAMTSALQPDEILTAIRIPKRGGGSAYEKLGRRGGHTDYAVAGASAWVSRSNGSVADARVALTGVGLKPELARGVMESIIGTDGSESAVAAAADRAAEGITVLEDLYGSVDYKAHLARVMVRRALTQAIAQA